MLGLEKPGLSNHAMKFFKMRDFKIYKMTLLKFGEFAFSIDRRFLQSKFLFGG